MEKIKQRDYMFDTFRGILILSIPMSHFTKMAGNQYGAMYLTGGFPEESLFGFVYITINVFVMQAFMFLSGYFSKKTDRAQETAFSTFLWPYLVFTVIYYFIRMFFMDGANLKLLTPPFALWFLFVLFFYRFFLKYMVKYNWLLPISIILYLLAGQIEEFGNFMSLGRGLSYFPFFLLGYYCSKERLCWLQGLKKRPIALILLGAALVGISFLLMHSDIKVGWYLLKSSVDSFPRMLWWQDTLMRVLIFFVASGWIVFMVNIIPSKKSFLSFVGMNTMPIYVFHLTLRYVVEFYGIYLGAISCLVVAWFAIISLIHRRACTALDIAKCSAVATASSSAKSSAVATASSSVKHTIAARRGYALIYGAAIIFSIVAFYIMYSSGCLAPLYNIVPKNIYLLYFLVYGSALICGISFVSPFWTKLYDLIISGPNKGSWLATWLNK